MKVVVIGAAGQLGSALLAALKGLPVTGLTREQLDLLDSARVREVLSQLRPTVVINTAAYLQVDLAEDQPEQAFLANGTAVLHLARLSSELGFKLVQISTDYVFGLEAGRSTPYRETDLPGPVGVYGQSKLLGEGLVQAYAERHLVVRSAGLYAPIGSRKKGGNFVETMLRLGAAKKALKVVADQVSTPTYAADLALGIRGLLEADAQGLYHLTNAGQVSWYELAQAIFRQAHLEVDLSPTTASAYGAKAKRPAYSVLDNKKAQALGVKLRPWDEALAAYLVARAHAG